MKKRNQRRKHWQMRSNTLPPVSYSESFAAQLKEINAAITVSPSESEAYGLNNTIDRSRRDLAVELARLILVNADIKAWTSEATGVTLIEAKCYILPKIHKYRTTTW